MFAIRVLANLVWGAPHTKYKEQDENTRYKIQSTKYETKIQNAELQLMCWLTLSWVHLDAR